MNKIINKTDLLDVKLYKSNEYSKFKFLEYNRNIIRKHVDRLKEELEKRDDLHLKPIIVTPDKEIVDGQHRFTAAEELGLYFYYLIDYEFHSDKLITHNTVNASWSCQDSFKHFLEMGNNDYFMFKNLLDKYAPLKMDSLLMVMKQSGGDFGTIRRDFREGRFKYKLTHETLLTLEVWRALKHELEERGFKQGHIHHCTNYLQAIYSFFTHKGIDRDRFFNCLSNKPFTLALFASKHEFLCWFAEVYNYRMKTNKVCIYRVGSTSKIKVE